MELSREPVVLQAVATLLATLRLAPTFAFAQPFTLVRVPAIVRVLLAIALSGWIVSAGPAAAWAGGYETHGLAVAAAGELLLGIGLALTLQFAFAALLTVGRSIDIQIGFGLAALVDPATRNSLPLLGTVLVYAAAAIFFLGDGPVELLALWSASFQAVPLGSGVMPDPEPLLAAVSAAFLVAMGIGGAVVLALFLIDLAIAFMSRTLPQMNVLVLGFQVKTLAALMLLPAAIGLSGGLFVKLVRIALDAGPQMLLP